MTNQASQDQVNDDMIQDLSPDNPYYMDDTPTTVMTPVKANEPARVTTVIPVVTPVQSSAREDSANNQWSNDKPWVKSTPVATTENFYGQQAKREKPSILKRWRRLPFIGKVGFITVILLIIMMVNSIISTLTPVKVQEPTVQVPYTVTNQAASTPNADLDLSGIEGQYWSNAKKILDSRNADTSNMLILTNNGKTPIMDSNWLVKSISKQSDGSLEVHLDQVTDYTGEAGKSLNDVGDSIGRAWDNLTNR